MIKLRFFSTFSILLLLGLLNSCSSFHPDGALKDVVEGDVSITGAEPKPVAPDNTRLPEKRKAPLRWKMELPNS